MSSVIHAETVRYVGIYYCLTPYITFNLPLLALAVITDKHFFKSVSEHQFKRLLF